MWHCWRISFHPQRHSANRLWEQTRGEAQGSEAALLQVQRRGWWPCAGSEQLRTDQPEREGNKGSTLEGSTTVTKTLFTLSACVSSCYLKTKRNCGRKWLMEKDTCDPGFNQRNEHRTTRDSAISLSTHLQNTKGALVAHAHKTA